MTTKYINEIRKINYLCNEIESLYHQASLKLGISDSVSIILYSINDMGGECLLTDIYKNTGISRQTINSAMRRLEADDILYLEPFNKKAKKVILTQKGKEYVQATVARILEAENAVYEEWSDDEIDAYIRLTEKFTQMFQNQVDQI